MVTIRFSLSGREGFSPDEFTQSSGIEPDSIWKQHRKLTFPGAAAFPLASWAIKVCIDDSVLDEDILGEFLDDIFLRLGKILPIWWNRGCWTTITIQTQTADSQPAIYFSTNILQKIIRIQSSLNVQYIVDCDEPEEPEG